MSFREDGNYEFRFTGYAGTNNPYFAILRQSPLVTRLKKKPDPKLRRECGEVPLKTSRKEVKCIQMRSEDTAQRFLFHFKQTIFYYLNNALKLDTSIRRVMVAMLFSHGLYSGEHLRCE